MNADIPADTSNTAMPWAQGNVRLRGLAWFVAFGFSAIGLAIIINQIFNFKAFGFSPISTSYYYIIVGLFLPVALLANAASSADRHIVRWYDWALAIIAFQSRGIPSASVAKGAISYCCLSSSGIVDNG